MVHAFDCRKDDLRNQRTSCLGHAFGPDDDATAAWSWTQTAAST